MGRSIPPVKTSLVMVCYNPLVVTKRSVDALISLASKSAEIVLVDNHSFDKETSRYVASLKSPRVKVVDPGHNMGCHNGYNMGFQFSSGDVLFKIDDDTVAHTPDFDQMIGHFLMHHIGYAFCSANILGVSEITPDQTQFNFEDFPMREGKIVNFSLVAWTRRTYKSLGPLKPHNSMIRPFSPNSLYSNEDAYYGYMATSRGLKKAVCMAAEAHHQGLEERPVLLTLWKWWYGAERRTTLDYTKFIKDKGELSRAFLAWRDSPDPWRKKQSELFFRGLIDERANGAKSQ